MLKPSHLNVRVGNTPENDFTMQTKTLIELLYYLIKNEEKLFLKRELSWNRKLHDFLMNIVKATIDVKQWTFLLCKQRLHFIRLQQKAAIDWKEAKFLKSNIKENTEYAIAAQMREFSSKLLATNQEWKMRKKHIEKEIESFKFHSKSLGRVRRSWKNDLYDAYFKTKKRYLDLLAKYDNNIGQLNICKKDLLVDKDSIESKYVVIQNELNGQRSLYNRLKEEHDLNVTKVFLAKLESFHRNRAAKIIQQNWRLYCLRVSGKKIKGKK
ncbi:uncharacterized protein LOC122399440 isoform X1 [Colletes gigas]|uniref:uncharacterized protein LOC122399440 isoform X1 n=1 Tax=Colletes gigas TaxID=935657 RepID=UPI001C9AAB54|nr:uncharacterized protein LOC122399440 isoform X1 [Colletes gigas]